MEPCAQPPCLPILREIVRSLPGAILFLFVITSFFSLHTSFAEDNQSARSQQLHAYIAAYEAKCTELRKPVVELRDQYLDKLKTLQERAQKGGKLESVLAIQKEITLVKENKLTEQSEIHDSLRNVRKIYERERNSREAAAENFIARKRSSLIRELEDFQRKLVQEGNTELAIETRTLVEKYTEEAKPPPKVIELFWETDFKGESVKLEVPVKVDRFGENPILKNDQLRSIRIPDGVRVEVGTAAALGGKTKAFVRDTANTNFPGVSSIEAK